MTRAWRGAVELDPRERAARPWLPASAGCFPRGCLLLHDDELAAGEGADLLREAVRVQPDGSCAPVVAFGSKSIASDPCATRRTA